MAGEAWTKEEYISGSDSHGGLKHLVSLSPTLQDMTVRLGENLRSTMPYTVTYKSSRRQRSSVVTKHSHGRNTMTPRRIYPEICNCIYRYAYHRRVTLFLLEVPNSLPIMPFNYLTFDHVFHSLPFINRVL